MSWVLEIEQTSLIRMTTYGCNRAMWLSRNVNLPSPVGAYWSADRDGTYLNVIPIMAGNVFPPKCHKISGDVHGGNAD